MKRFQRVSAGGGVSLEKKSPKTLQYGLKHGETTYERKTRHTSFIHKTLNFRCLRACPPEDQAEVIHAISPISVKLGQIEGHTQ